MDIEISNVVGSMFGTGFWIVSGSVGFIFGVACTVGIKVLFNKKKKGGESDDAETE